MLPASGLVFILIALLVGQESILALSTTRELQCGRKLVSGLFSRPRLPYGYSYITTVPRGACRLNVSEIVANDNYIALKIFNSSYIINGEFALSAPGTYEAAGTRFIYSRSSEHESISALGPLQSPIDIMILYTQPNPSLKYEYFTESIPNEIELESTSKFQLAEGTPTAEFVNFRRHNQRSSLNTWPKIGSKYPDLDRNTLNVLKSTEQTVGEKRKFIWKILSYSQCSRTCGGGIQHGKYRCVQANADDIEVSPVHCTTSPPPAKQRRCGSVTCPPRWRAGSWSACPRCGPATKHRMVGCVEDHAKGITKISDQKCPAEKPPTTEKCDIPDCDEEKGSTVPPTVLKRVLHERSHTDTFRAGPVYTVAKNSTIGSSPESQLGPEYSFSATAGWIYSKWSECVGSCVGGGIQTRRALCPDPSGCVHEEIREIFRECPPSIPCEPMEGTWFTGAWSPCSGCEGKQSRGVLCIGGSGRHLKDAACTEPKPPSVRDCKVDCEPTWFVSDWGQCVGKCSLSTSNIGLQRRTVLCGYENSPAPSDKCPEKSAPADQRICYADCDFSTTPLPPTTPESQSALADGTPMTSKSTVTYHDCKDKLNNCRLAVQARLCHYKYYINNCCQSCSVR